MRESKRAKLSTGGNQSASQHREVSRRWRIYTASRESLVVVGSIIPNDYWIGKKVPRGLLRLTRMTKPANLLFKFISTPTVRNQRQATTTRTLSIGSYDFPSAGIFDLSPHGASYIRGLVSTFNLRK